MLLFSFPCDDDDDDAEGMNQQLYEFREKQNAELNALTFKIIGSGVVFGVLVWAVIQCLKWLSIIGPSP